jgi:hypothetical protein
VTAVRPSRAELRHAVLARLSTFTEEIEWVGIGAHVAFADSIVDFADWLAACTPSPPPLAGTGASRDAIEAAKRAAADAVAASKERRGAQYGSES